MALSISRAHAQAEQNHAARIAVATSVWQSATQNARDGDAANLASAMATADAARSAANAASQRQLDSDRSALARALTEFGAQQARADNSAPIFAALAVRDGCDPTVAGAALDV